MIASGFKIINDVLTTVDCDNVIKKLSANDSFRSRAGIRNLMRDPLVAAIAADGRLISIIRAIFGRRLIPYKATLFQKTGKANWLVAWHQDTALPLESVPAGDGWGPASVKDGITFVHSPTWALSKILALRIHHDASIERNGPLKIIPGSHRKRITDDAAFREWCERPFVECRVEKVALLQ